MYRKLWLKNAKGDEFTFTDKNSKYFLSQLSGLGFQKEVNGYTYGNVSKITSTTYNFLTVSGALLFYDKRENAYQDYFNFVKFISLEPIQLYYLPPNTLSPYYCEVQITQADKGEYLTNGYLSVNIAMLMTTHWKDSVETVIEARNEVVGDGKQYPLERPYYYASNSLSNIRVMNKGSDDIGFIIEITGDCQNPMWSVSQGGEIYGSCKINGTYDKVVVNSKDAENEIYLELNGSSITNPASYQDLSITGGILTFIKLRPGISVINFTCSDIVNFNGSVKVRFNSSYISV